MTLRMRTTTAMATTRMMVIATKTENDRGKEDIVNCNDKDEYNDGFDADSATLL